MKTFTVQHDCGCCFSDVQFESRERAEAALAAVGLGNNKSIQDDTGKQIHGIDTFYGVFDETETTDQPLIRLINALSKKVQ